MRFTSTKVHAPSLRLVQADNDDDVGLPCGAEDGDVHALADGELDVGAAAAVRAHIAGCISCRRQWDATISVRRLLVAASRTRVGR